MNLGLLGRGAGGLSSLGLFFFACSSPEPAPDPNAGAGASGAAGKAGTGGAPTAGAGGNTPGAGGTAAGTAGSFSVAGSTATAGSAGAASGGTGGSSGVAGSGGAPNAGSAGAQTGGAGSSAGSAGAAMAGSGGALAGQGGGAGSPPSTCTSGMRDGDETGVDCGGSCEPCVIYQIDPPLLDNPDARSGCEPNGTGFMCVQAQVFSPQMLQAARDDWDTLAPPFVYGVVGHDPDPNGVDADSSDYASTCCQCYQLVFKGPSDGNVQIPAPKPMIVQAFNTYAGGPTAFDIFMAVGGHGNFNGCTENGRQYSAYPDTGGDWSGGVRATRYSQCASDNAYTESSIAAAGCQDFIESECNKVEAPEPVQSISRDSCIATNRSDTHYHMNWNVVVKRVECPENLTRVTGCRLNDQGLPAADPAVDTLAEAMSSGFRDGYHTTTMQDCCRPTCAWPTNTRNTAAPYSIFYSCNPQGEPYTE